MDLYEINQGELEKYYVLVRNVLVEVMRGGLLLVLHVKIGQD